MYSFIYLFSYTLCFTKGLKQCLAKNLMAHRRDKNIIFTGCSFFKIRSSRVSLLFLNRPEGPLENSLSGIILSGGKNDQNLLQTAASEKSHRVPADTRRGRAGRLPGQPATCSTQGPCSGFTSYGCRSHRPPCQHRSDSVEKGEWFFMRTYSGLCIHDAFDARVYTADITAIYIKERPMRPPEVK